MSKRPISPSRLLLAMLEDKQTHPDGRVWYGRPITYAKIAGWFGEERPAERTLRRWMAELRVDRKVTARLVMSGTVCQGLRVVIVAPRKHFQVMAAQMSLFVNPVVQMPVQKAVEKPVEKLRNSQDAIRPLVTGGWGHQWTDKDFALKEHLKKKELAPASGSPPPLTIEKQRPWEKKPRTPQERERKLGELYALKRTLLGMSPGNHRFSEFVARTQHLEDELVGNVREIAFEDTG